jgi:hypothetical protein
LLERWRYGVKCPIANHGNIAMCKGEETSMVAEWNELGTMLLK